MKNKYALITGASAGLGVEFARQLAEKGYNLVITARREDRLKKLKSELQRSLNVKVEIIPADLSKPGDVKKLSAIIHKKKIIIDYLVNNAGYGYYGDLTDKKYPEWENMIHVNLNALVYLTLEFLPQMKERRAGNIMFVSSVAGFMAVPYFSMYAALKASVLHLGEALAEELSGTDVKLSVLCPGSTATEFFNVASNGAEIRQTKGMADPADVVRQGLLGLESGKYVIVPGLLNKIQVFILRVTSRRFIAKIAGIIIKKMR